MESRFNIYSLRDDLYEISLKNRIIVLLAPFDWEIALKWIQDISKDLHITLNELKISLIHLEKSLIHTL